MTDRSTIITPQAPVDWVYDPQRDALHFVSKVNAGVYTYSLSQGGFTGALSIGGTPNSVANSPDGRWLVIGNETAITTGATSSAIITRVDLTTNAFDQVTAPLPYVGARGVAHIAVDAHGAVIFDTLTGSAYANNFLTFPVAAPSPAVQEAGPLSPLDDAHAFFSLSSYILSSPDHNFLLVQDTRGAPSREALYDTGAGGLIAINDWSGFDELPRGGQVGRGDVANNGLVVDVTTDDVRVFDPHLHLVRDLSSYAGRDHIVDAVFSQDAQELFLWNGAGKTVYVLDTHNWSQIATLTTTIGGTTGNQSMLVVDHGSMLALNNGVQVELIDLAARLNLTTGPAPATPDPALPLGPHLFPDAGVTVAGDMVGAHLSDLLPATIFRADDVVFAASGPGALKISLTGHDLAYANDQLVGGTVTSLAFTDVQGGATTLDFSLASSSGWFAPQFETWLLKDDTAGAFRTLLAGSDGIRGGTAGDVIYGYAGNDEINGLGGDDTLFGGQGDDGIYATAATGPNAPTTFGPAGSTYLRGEEGNDYIVGGAGFDNINGNQGNDTATGGAGGDWVLGGQGDDMLFGDVGDDILNGNLGTDICVGGAGDDFVRGGQGDDALYGGDGNDWLSGDLGSNTLTGGQGADRFHAGAGSDVVADFTVAQGDRVEVDHGVTYQTSQVGADVHVDLSNGGHMVLQNVELSNLPSGWIVTT